MKKLYTILHVTLIAFAVNGQVNPCVPATAFEYLDINNVKARINNGGDMWWDLLNDAEYFVPQSGNVSAQFAGALWIGGIDAQGQLSFAAQTYRQTGNDFFPGPLDTNAATSQPTCALYDRIWKVNRDEIDSMQQLALTYGTSIPASLIPPAILDWPGKGNPSLGFVQQDMAPYIDVDGNGNYDAAGGDYPDVPGDQALWFVFNDNGNIHTETGGEPASFEVQTTAYSFKGDGTCYSALLSIITK